jgi:hypothetical protein
MADCVVGSIILIHPRHRTVRRVAFTTGISYQKVLGTAIIGCCFLPVLSSAYLLLLLLVVASSKQDRKNYLAQLSQCVVVV